MKRTLWITPPPLQPGELWQGWLLLAATQLLTPTLAAVLAAALPLDPARQGLWQNLLYFGLNLAGCLTVFRRQLLQQLNALRRHWRRGFLVAAVGFWAYYGLNLGLAALIGRFAPGFHNLNDGALAALARDGYWPLLVGTVVLVPLAEELLYRTLLIGSLGRYSRTAAVCISVALFSAIHLVGYLGPGGYGPAALFWAFLQYALPATVLCLSYGFGGSLLSPLVIHTLINLLGMLEMR